MSAPPVYVGIDVSEGPLDIAVLPSNEAWRAANDPDGIDALALRLSVSEAALVVMEATGGYEHAVAAHLASAGRPVAVVNPRQVRDFAKATGELAKTDALDARVLALFAERVRPEPRELPDASQRALEALLSRRRQLIGMLVAERNRLLLADAAIRKSRPDRPRSGSTSGGWRRSSGRSRTRWGGPSRRARCGVRSADRMGRAGRGPECALHVGAGVHHAQPVHRHVLPASRGGGEAEEGGAGSEHAEAARHAQRDGAERAGVGRGPRGSLTPDTVAVRRPSTVARARGPTHLP
jgi:hypothetical protein